MERGQKMIHFIRKEVENEFKINFNSRVKLSIGKEYFIEGYGKIRTIDDDDCNTFLINEEDVYALFVTPEVYRRIHIQNILNE